MTRAPHIALMAALDLPDDAAASGWVHLLPPPGEVRTYDGRGPYRYADMDQVIAASLADPRFGAIDENHATDLAAPKGGPAPARGWIRELQARQDGIWGRVDWTDEGGHLVASRAYRGLSPVILIDAQDGKTVRAIARASLVNLPNLRGLTALHQENSMTFMERLAEKLGLPKDATEEQILAAISGGMPAMQSALTEIGAALGVEGGDHAAVLAAARARATASGTVASLQSENAQLSERVAALEAAAREAASRGWLNSVVATRAVPAQEHATLLSLHASNPEMAERVAGMFPALGATVPTGIPGATTGAPGGTITSLNAEQKAAADLLGIAHDKYLATLVAEQKDAH